MMAGGSGVLPEKNIWPAVNDRVVGLPSYASPSIDEVEPEKRFWGTLKERLDFALLTPRRIDDVEAVKQTSASGQEYYILKNPAASTYIKLGPEDYFLWTLMDGNRMVKDLVVEYYKVYRTFAFARIGSLISQLSEAMFLTTLPVHLYHRLRNRLESQTAASLVNRFWKGFRQYEMAIDGIDGFITATYKKGVFWLFTRPMQLIYFLVSLCGLYAFYQVFHHGKYSIAQHNGSYVIGIVLLLAINILLIAVHEGAHAYTCKYYGRQVRRGGFMIYYGMPAFFVDTMDIWMEPKKARIMVSWAGPYADIILCGLCSIYIVCFPSSELNPILFKVACLCFFSFFTNLDPLLELDGYFILMDWLEMPLLRHKSLNFIQTALWPKLKALARFSRADIIMTVYGSLAAVWSGIAILLSLYFWKLKLSGLMLDWWNRGGTTHYIMVAVVVVGIAAPLVWVVGYKLLEYGRKLFVLIDQTGFFDNIPYVFASLLAVSLLLPLLTLFYSGTWPYLPYLRELILLAAIFQAYQIQSFYKDSHLQNVFRLFTVGLFTLFLAGLPFTPLPLAAYIFSLAFLGAVSILFYFNDFRTPSPLEKLSLLAGCVLILASEFLVIRGDLGAGALFSTGEIAGLVLIQALTFTLLICHIIAYVKTGFEYVWIFLAAGLVINLVLSLAPLGISYYQFADFSSGYEFLQLLSCLSISAGFLLYRHILLRTRVVSHEDEIVTAITEKEMLTSVFSLFYQGVFNNLQLMYGKRRAHSVEDKLNRFAAAAQYDLHFSRGKVADLTDQGPDIIDLAEMYRVLLAHLIAEATKLTGSKIMHRNLVAIYDRLYWQNRELAHQYLLTGMKWAAPLIADDEQDQENYEAMFNQLPLFSELDAVRLKRLKALLRIKTFYPASNIVTVGETGDKFYIIKTGKVEVIVPTQEGEQVVAELSAGDFFGEIALIRNVPRTATVRAKTLVEVFVLERSGFHKLTEEFEDLDGKFRRAIENGNIVRKMPLFKEFSGEQINCLLAKLTVEKVVRDTVVINQGDQGDKFYIIKSGQAEILAADPAGSSQTVACLGPGEYFGEIALLLDLPRTATVRVVADIELLVLRKKDFNELLGDSMYFSKNMEQVSSRRLYDLEQKTGLHYA